MQHQLLLLRLLSGGRAPEGPRRAVQSGRSRGQREREKRAARRCSKSGAGPGTRKREPLPSSLRSPRAASLPRIAAGARGAALPARGEARESAEGARAGRLRERERGEGAFFVLRKKEGG